jgi:hypothetical protein
MTMVLLFVWSIIMHKIGKKRSFLIGNLVRVRRASRFGSDSPFIDGIGFRSISVSHSDGDHYSDQSIADCTSIRGRHHRRQYGGMRLRYAMVSRCQLTDERAMIVARVKGDVARMHRCFHARNRPTARRDLLHVLLSRC